MNVEIVARNYPVDERLRLHIEEKLGKVVKFLDDPVEVRVTVEQEKHRHIAELHIAHKRGVLQAQEETSDMLEAVHLVIDKVERQARRQHQKRTDRRRRADRYNGQAWPVEVLERASVVPGSPPRIIKASLLHIKPMTIDEAALQLEASKNEFVVFRDSTSERVNVLYKRKDNNYGLIAPDF